MINTNNIIFNKWTDFYYELDPQIITKNKIIAALSKLYSELNQLSNDLTILIQFKIKIDNNNFRSISYLQSINIDQFNELKDIFIEFWNFKDEDYISLKASHIIFTYKIINPNFYKIKPKINRTKLLYDNTINFKGYNLPNTMDYHKWGNIISESDNFVLIKKYYSKLFYYINVFDNYYNIQLKYKDKILVEFTDKILEKGKLDSLTRHIKNQEYIFIDGKLNLKKIVKQTKFLKKIIPSGFINKNLITMDLETRTIEGIMTPYCIRIYEGININSFYLLDYKNSEEMLVEAIKSIMIYKYNKYKVYIHNFSFFDGIFLIKIFSQLTDTNLKTIIREDRIIDLKFKFNYLSNKISLYFRDSYLLLPSSLNKLAINFKVENKKIFPYKFVNNKNIFLDYIGEVPSINNFINLSDEDYLNYCNSFNKNKWDLRNETIEYCNQDVITLHQIISKFQKKIFELFRVDILKYPTLSSLAFAIYSSNFLKDYNIPLIDGDLFI